MAVAVLLSGSDLWGLKLYKGFCVCFQMEDSSYFLMIGFRCVGSDNSVGKFICSVIAISG